MMLRRLRKSGSESNKIVDKFAGRVKISKQDEWILFREREADVAIVYSRIEICERCFPMGNLNLKLTNFKPN